MVQAIGPGPTWDVLMFKCVGCRSWWRASLIYDGEAGRFY